MTTSRPDASRLDQRRAERGSATVLAVVMVGLLTALALGGAVVGGLLVAQRRAAAAADLAALAGAEALASGNLVATAGGGCDRASGVAADNGAELTGCGVEGQEVVVRVAVEVANPWGGSWEVPAVARAGPAVPTAVGGSGP